MPWWVVVPVGVVCMVMEGAAVAALGSPTPGQVILTLLVYMASRRPFDVGAWVLALWMLPAEWLAGGVTGVYSLGLALVYVLLRPLHPVLDRSWGGVHLGAVALVTLLHHLLLALIWSLTRPALAAAAFWTAPTSVVSATVVALPLGLLLQRLDRLMDPRQAADAGGLLG